MEKDLIGILAGMGPKYTAPFVDILIDECQKQFGASLDELPSMMIYTMPTPFNKDYLVNHNLMKNMIKTGLLKLQDAGVSFIAVPFSSAYVYYEELQHEIRIPLLNMISETIQNLPSEVKKIAVFASEETISSGIYQEKIKRMGGQFIYKEEWQYKINMLINSVKTKNENPQNNILWHELIKDVQALSTECLIIDGFEHELLVPRESIKIPVISAVRCLALAVARSYRADLICGERENVKNRDTVDITVDIQE